MDTISGFLPFQYRHYHKVDVGRLQVDAPDPPRYLIRVHSTYSQGCMTDDSFVSAAESWAQQNDLAPPNLQQYNSVEFERHVHNHLTNFKGNNTEPFRSPFISLTVSLRLALAWAKMRSLWGHRDIRIVVLDTSTIPASNCDCGTSCEDPFHQNPIWPADMIYKVCNGVTKDFPDEFLAFGHVRGVFKICTFAELETTFLNQYIPELSRLPRDQRYEELPMTLQDLWSTDQPLRPGDRDLVIHVAKQLSNDDLLIPMVAFVLCIRRRLVDDRDVLGTVVRAARLVEKQKTYDFLGYFDAFPIIDFFSKRSNKPILTADSVELVQTSAILERVKLCFAETQETEARKMWDCTTVALICRYFCPRRIREAVSRTSLQSRKSLSTDLARNFSRLQVAVFRSKFSGLRLLRDALLKAAREYGLNSGILTPVSVRYENEHEFWTRQFGEIATHIELFDGDLNAVPISSTVRFDLPEDENQRPSGKARTVEPAKDSYGYIEVTSSPVHLEVADGNLLRTLNPMSTNIVKKNTRFAPKIAIDLAENPVEEPECLYQDKNMAIDQFKRTSNENVALK